MTSLKALGIREPVITYDDLKVQFLPPFPPPNLPGRVCEEETVRLRGERPAPGSRWQVTE